VLWLNQFRHLKERQHVSFPTWLETSHKVHEGH
jgi:hypothetical protein